MSEVSENESKSKFAGRQNENSANLNCKMMMKKSRKRKRASKQVRRVKKMRLEKENYSLFLQKCKITISTSGVLVLSPFLALFTCDKSSSTERFFSYFQLFLSGRESTNSQSVLESEILPELRHGSKGTCNNKIEIICLDSTSKQNNNEYIETIILDSTSEQKCDKKIEVINLDSNSEQNNNAENIEIIILDSTSEQKCDEKIEVINLDSTSEQNNNAENIEIIILDSTSEQKCDEKIEITCLGSASEQKNNENTEIINLDSSLSFEFTNDSWPTGENPFSLSGSFFSAQHSSCDESDSEDETPEHINKLASLGRLKAFEI
ncbi:uncharacterized protein [Acropora muricata]|uniref:uncharacterized protein n=1 Tax=Acropora muricata TaxID=159855 RepID=UPI0034E5CC28